MGGRAGDGPGRERDRAVHARGLGAGAAGPGRAGPGGPVWTEGERGSGVEPCDIEGWVGREISNAAEPIFACSLRTAKVQTNQKTRYV